MYTSLPGMVLIKPVKSLCIHYIGTECGAWAACQLAWRRSEPAGENTIEHARAAVLPARALLECDLEGTSFFSFFFLFKKKRHTSKITA